MAMYVTVWVKKSSIVENKDRYGFLSDICFLRELEENSWVPFCEYVLREKEDKIPAFYWSKHIIERLEKIKKRKKLSSLQIDLMDIAKRYELYISSNVVEPEWLYDEDYIHILDLEDIILKLLREEIKSWEAK